MTYLSAQQQHGECVDTPIVAHTQNLVTRLIKGVAQWFHLIQRREYLKVFAEMDNQQLSDIGLDRSDVFEAANLDRNVDVTCHLARVAQRRRQQSRNYSACG